MGTEKPNMKFAICVLAFALMATIEAAPATETGDYGSDSITGSKYFAATGKLDGVQGPLLDIEAAGTDLETIKGKLEALADSASLVYAAESALETAVDSSVYANAFKAATA